MRDEIRRLRIIRHVFLLPERRGLMIKEFKEFIMRGNVVDMAVGIVIGAAFGAIVKSFVDDILMPVIGLLLGNVDFANFFLVLKAGKVPGPYATLMEAKAATAVTLNYGLFINVIVAFLIVAFAIFLMIKQINALKRQEAQAAPTTKECPFCLSAVPLKAIRCPQCTSELKA
jgi:large conductance mechanosensitive channel